MCKSAPHILPYSAFHDHTETLQADTSQDIRHLALIDMKGCRYQQLPLTNSQLFRLIEKHAESASVEVETEAKYIEPAQERLHEFAIDPVNAYASIRFLCMQQIGAKAVQAATEKIVNDLLKLMEDNDLRHVWASWHPHRFAAVAAYAYLFVADPAKATSQWNWMVVPKRTYIPIDEIHRPSNARIALPVVDRNARRERRAATRRWSGRRGTTRCGGRWPSICDPAGSMRTLPQRF